jgi:hypothetical protein
MKTLLLTLLILSGCGREEDSSSSSDSTLFSEVHFCQGFLNGRDEITTLIVYKFKSGDYYLTCMESDIQVGILTFGLFFRANSLGIQSGSLPCLDLDYSIKRNMAFYRGEGITCEVP